MPLGELLMAECVYCKTETELYENGRPLCISCAGAKDANSVPVSGESQIRLELLQEVRRTTDRVNAAAEQFSLIIKDIPSKVPPPDSTHRIEQASRELSIARAEMMRAHHRLNDFLSDGVIPEDLEQSSSGSPRK
jgi:hypothetical protein